MMVADCPAAHVCKVGIELPVGSRCCLSLAALHRSRPRREMLDRAYQACVVSSPLYRIGIGGYLQLRRVQCRALKCLPLPAAPFVLRIGIVHSFLYGSYLVDRCRWATSG